ncbi:MAG TPA: fibronectin type III domain-containing protein [Candidatus Paceibacterota bacterium]|nr:fibronectin type III domain-containing protein [Candidatus Paceibacterota bacterium]
MKKSLSNTSIHLAAIAVIVLGVLYAGFSILFYKTQSAYAITCGTGSNVTFTVVGSQCRAVITSGSSFTVPSDWSNSNNTIEVIGGGGGGKTSAYATGGGPGGGGGAYAKVSNVSLSGTITYRIGAGGASDGGVGGDTYFNGTGTTCAAQTVCAKGGGGGAWYGTGGAGGSAASSIGSVKYSGGDGGGYNSTGSGAGGGGAAGPNGAGVAGVYAGPGSYNGTSGGAGDAGAGGAGGAGGSGGSAGVYGTGGTNGTEWGTAGAGGGGGGGGGTSNTNGTGGGGSGGLYGGGGGGSGYSNAGGPAQPGAAGAQGVIVVTYTPITVPGAPTIGTATAGDAQATVTFTAPASDGGSPITSYTVTSSPGGITASGAASPLTVTGLTNGVSYTFTVKATNAVGTGAASAASNSVTPQLAIPTCTLLPSSQTISYGNAATINYTISGTATSATINGVAVPPNASGVYSPLPVATTTYSMVVSNSNGTNSCGPVTVNVSGSGFTGGTGALLTGYFWSDTIGWIDANCYNTNSCTTNNFGLFVDNSGNISGYGWSDNIGWVSAQPSDVSGCPSSPCTPNINATTGVVSGWFRAIAANGNGWDGWISLSGSNYGPTFSNGNFSGYSWGSDVVGWVDWSQVHTAWASCTAQYFCSATSTNDQYYTSAQCATTFVQHCSYQCSSGACVPPPAPTGTLRVTPALVHSGTKVSVTWNVSTSPSCRVTGTNGDAWNGTSGTATSSTILQNVTYTLSCADNLGATSTVGTATVSLVPVWQEL